LPDQPIKSAYFALVLGKNQEKVMRVYGIIDGVGFDIEEIRKLERKGKYKKAKGKK
jgi:hypothetical protein